MTKVTVFDICYRFSSLISKFMTTRSHHPKKRKLISGSVATEGIEACCRTSESAQPSVKTTGTLSSTTQIRMAGQLQTDVKQVNLTVGGIKRLGEVTKSPNDNRGYR